MPSSMRSTDTFLVKGGFPIPVARGKSGASVCIRIPLILSTRGILQPAISIIGRNGRVDALCLEVKCLAIIPAVVAIVRRARLQAIAKRICHQGNDVKGLVIVETAGGHELPGLGTQSNALSLAVQCGAVERKIAVIGACRSHVALVAYLRVLALSLGLGSLSWR
jgi:hypothetical protein